jgi:hypothetical protein
MIAETTKSTRFGVATCDGCGSPTRPFGRPTPVILYGGIALRRRACDACKKLSATVDQGTLGGLIALMALGIRSATGRAQGVAPLDDATESLIETAIASASDPEFEL